MIIAPGSWVWPQLLWETDQEGAGSMKKEQGQYWQHLQARRQSGDPVGKHTHTPHTPTATFPILAGNKQKAYRTSEAYENVSNVWKKKQVRGRLPNNCQSAEGQLSIPVKAGGGQAQGEAIIRDPLCLLQSALERRILTFPPLANDLKNQAIACNHVL